MSLPVIVLGCGGHARVLIEAIILAGDKILGVTDPKPERELKIPSGIPFLGNDDDVLKYPNSSVLLVNGLGSVSDTSLHTSVYRHFKAKGYGFATVMHPSAVIASDVAIGEGAQIMAGVVIQNGTWIGHNVIVNTRASVDHDCIISPHAHVAPGVTLSGGVEVGEGTHIGTGATVIQGVRIGPRSVIGAGAVVVKDVPGCCTVTGIPAKVVKR